MATTSFYAIRKKRKFLDGLLKHSLLIDFGCVLNFPFLNQPQNE